MVWVIHFCSPVAELNRWLGIQKLSGVGRLAQTRQVHINSHAYACIHHRIQLAVGDMTMSGWKLTISLIHTHQWPHDLGYHVSNAYNWIKTPTKDPGSGNFSARNLGVMASIIIILLPLSVKLRWGENFQSTMGTRIHHRHCVTEWEVHAQHLLVKLSNVSANQCFWFLHKKKSAALCTTTTLRCKTILLEDGSHWPYGELPQAEIIIILPLSTSRGQW